MKTPAKRRTGEVTASNVSTEQTWCTGESPYTCESITSESAYRIQTFNTTDWYTSESVYTGESITIIRRIRFQRPTQQISTPANRRTQANRLPSFGVSDSNVQLTDWHTGESAYTGESITINWRIRFQRSTQQIGTPANRRTQANRLPSFGVSDSNVQHNRLVHRRSGVPATGDRRPASRRIRFQRSTQQIGTPARRRTGDRRPAIGDRRPATGDRRVAV